MKDFYYSNSFGDNIVYIDDYKGELEDPKTIELLLDKNIRDAIINFEEARFKNAHSQDFLSYIWSKGNNKIKHILMFFSYGENFK